MPTLTIEQAGKEYVLVQSNSGLRVEDGNGNELFRHWPDRNPPEIYMNGAPGDAPQEPPRIRVASDAELAEAMETAEQGTVFELAKGEYSFNLDPAKAFKFMGEAT